jgi:hypothetical protein
MSVDPADMGPEATPDGASGPFGARVPIKDTAVPARSGEDDALLLQPGE